MMIPSWLEVGACRVLHLDLFNRLSLVVIHHGNGGFTLVVDQKITIHPLDGMIISPNGILRVQKDERLVFFFTHPLGGCSKF